MSGGYEMTVRWADIDALGHVNNAIVLIYLDEGRDAHFTDWGIARTGYVVARCEIDFRAEITLDTRRIRIDCELLRVGRTSIRTREVITDEEGRVMAEAEVVCVLWDRETRGPREVSAAERERLGELGAAVGS